MGNATPCRKLCSACQPAPRGAQTSACLLSTTRSSAGWPVASSHALLAFSRIPSRSAPATASLSGKSEAGPSLVRGGRSQPSPLPTSEQGLSLRSSTLLLAGSHPLPGGGRQALLVQSEESRDTGCAGECCEAPWQIKVLFSYRTLCFPTGLVNTVPLPGTSNARSWLLEPKQTKKQTRFKPTHLPP